MNSGFKNITIALGIITIAFAGYYLYSQQADPLMFGTNDAMMESMLMNTQVFIERREQLSAIKLDTSLFDDYRFQSLVSYREDIIPRQQGRMNPFDLPEPPPVSLQDNQL